MKGKYLKRIGAFIFAAMMLAGIAFTSAATTEAQVRRRVVIVRPIPYRFYRSFGYRDRFGYPYSYYSHYVFRNSESALNQGYKDGFSTGKSDGKKTKSFDPQRSHYYYDAGFGNFAEVYRSGFSRGYNEGYRAGNNDRLG